MTDEQLYFASPDQNKMTSGIRTPSTSGLIERYSLSLYSPLMTWLCFRDFSSSSRQSLNSLFVTNKKSGRMHGDQHREVFA